MRGRLLFVTLSLVLFSGLSGQFKTAQSQRVLDPTNNGHTIHGAFLEYYNLSPNPKEIYGEPITEAFTDPRTNLLVQYFEKARFEYHPTEPPQRQVHLSPLGINHYLLARDQILPNQVIDNWQGCRVFSDTGLHVCMAFLAYFEANGGEYTFGPPVSNAVWLNGRLVQYFFYSRLEWHPDLPIGKNIQVSNLGYEFIYINQEDTTRLAPPKNNTIFTITKLNAQAIAEQSITSMQGRQTVHIRVTDQRNLPVDKAQVVVIVRLPSGEESRYIVPQITNQDGVTQFTFPFNSNLVGMAEIQVTVTRDNLQTKTSTSFHIWW